MTSKKKDISEMNYDMTKKMLDDTGRCLIIRPTGFGKTYIMTHICKLYKSVIYLVPRKSIINQIYGQDKGKFIDFAKSKIKFLTYQKLVFMSKRLSSREDYFEYFNAPNSKNTLIIFDEAHSMGADKTSFAIDKLLKVYTKAHYLGGTATPNRSDLNNYRLKYFGNDQLPYYGIMDAIKDGIFVKPLYVYSLYGWDTFLEDIEKEIDKDNTVYPDKRKIQLVSEIKRSRQKFIKEGNVSNILSKYVEKMGYDTHYMKYLVFFHDCATLEAKHEEIERDFAKAFPLNKIRSTIVCSDSAKHISNKNIINNLHAEKDEGVIDLIFSVDMLSLGYHSDDITGIIMFRPTDSDIVYRSQIGRVFSINSTNRPIIFDFVGNLSRNQKFHSAVINQKTKKNSNIYDNDIEDFATECFEFIDETISVEKIKRIVSDRLLYINADVVIRAYRYKHAPVGFCIKALHLDSEDAFYKYERQYVEE